MRNVEEARKRKGKRRKKCERETHRAGKQIKKTKDQREEDIKESKVFFFCFLKNMSWYENKHKNCLSKKLDCRGSNLIPSNGESILIKSIYLVGLIDWRFGKYWTGSKLSWFGYCPKMSLGEKK